MRRLLGPIGLLVPVLKTALVLYGEQNYLPIVRAIYFPVLCR